jgi:hypothetical protein
MASMARKFQTELTTQLARDLIHQHECWLSVATYVLRYEDMVLDQQAELRRLQAALGLQAQALEPILAQLNGLNYDSPGARNEKYHSENLFHKGHITDGRVRAWHAQLPPHLEDEIVSEHREWFRRFGLDR